MTRFGGAGAWAGRAVGVEDEAARWREGNPAVGREE